MQDLYCPRFTWPPPVILVMRSATTSHSSVSRCGSSTLRTMTSKDSRICLSQVLPPKPMTITFHSNISAYVCGTEVFWTLLLVFLPVTLSPLLSEARVSALDCCALANCLLRPKAEAALHVRPDMDVRGASSAPVACSVVAWTPDPLSSLSSPDPPADSVDEGRPARPDLSSLSVLLASLQECSSALILLRWWFLVYTMAPEE
mmetsp:Transcript_60310/g.162659  ORF Transcript_60310/g.162659 Transcript_60310/m.162659 type:complete len:203 (+) Transcript_60310:253-861(+)